ncbi:hypothetical protein MJO29_005716 [Puccinia striiformis f. sp. tritici]|nr:hypothetical protein MJO29_005716 [Puccinia striiformis f. sp. tritici]
MKELEGLGVFLKTEDFHPQWHLLDLPVSGFMLFFLFLSTQKPSDYPFFQHNLTPEFESPAVSQPSDEVYDKVFLGKILDRFQALPTHEKPEWILRFGKLLDMTHVLKRLEEPIDQPCKGRPRGSKNKSKAPAKSTKPEPSRHEHLAAPKKRGRPRKDKDSKEESKKKKLNNKQKNGKRKKSDTGKSLSESTEGSSSDDEELTDRENQIGIATVAATLTALSTSTAPDVLETSSNTDVWSNFNESHPNLERVALQARPLILSIHNVEGNVNCGFRAAAISTGKLQEEWGNI